MSQVRSPLGGQRHGRMGKSGYKQSWRRALSARQSERVNEDQDGTGRAINATVTYRGERAK